ncbi:hypothetical protein AMTRI_Chr12g238720 [Amborella trichopoda]
MGLAETYIISLLAAGGVGVSLLLAAPEVDSRIRSFLSLCISVLVSLCSSSMTSPSLPSAVISSLSTKLPSPSHPPQQISPPFFYNQLHLKTFVSNPTFIQNPQLGFTMHASRRAPSFRQEAGIVREPVGHYEEEEEMEEQEEEEDDRSLDLLVRFIQNVFRKISKRARKAVRSVLPIAIPTKLVGFSVNGVLIIAFLWVLKALLEVVCTLGSIVFVSILFIRGTWAGLSYFQNNHPTHRSNGGLYDDDSAWDGVQPAT